MALPSSFLCIAVTVLGVCHLTVSQPLDSEEVSNFQAEVPDDLETAEILFQNEKNLAHQLALDYLYDGEVANDFTNFAKRDPRNEEMDKKDTRTLYDNYARRNIPPNFIKLNFGKRTTDKRFNSPFIFGKREDLSEVDKKAYSPFLYGKRERDLDLQPDKRAGYSKFMFGKRDGSEDDKRAGYSVLYFGKRVPEVAKRGFSKLYYGKRGSKGKGGYSKFVFGKREDMDKREDLAEDKRFKSSFYLGKRNFAADNDEVQAMENV